MLSSTAVRWIASRLGPGLLASGGGSGGRHACAATATGLLLPEELLGEDVGRPLEGLPRPYANLDELEEDARPLLTKEAYAYYVSGSETEVGFRSPPCL